MRLIGNFTTEDTRRLTSQLSALEDNIDRETRDIRASFLPNFERRLFSPDTIATATLLPGQVAICDTTVASFTLNLSAPTTLAPGMLAVIKKLLSNTVTVVPSGQVLSGVARTINATTSFSCASVGLYLFYFDGSNWFKAI